MRTPFILPLFLLIVLCSGATAQEGESPRPVDVSDLPEGDHAAFIEYLDQRARPPLDYTLGAFESHDVVLLGEVHQIRENCLFVARLIEPLYRKVGVRILATEFLRSRHQPRVDELVSAPEWDEALAMEIFRDGPWPTWGYREYMDILKAAWSLNQGLPPDAERFRVIGLDSDWSQYRHWFEQSAMARMKTQLEREEHMVETLEANVLAKKRKALVHLGYAHSVTCHGVRFGTVLRQKYGERIFQIALHQRLSKRLCAFLERHFARAGGSPVGFDVIGSPIASLTDRESQIFRFLRDADLAKLAEGYVFLAPVEELHKVSWIEGHIDEAHFEEALAVAIKMGWVEEGECATAEELDRKMQKVYPPPSTSPAPEPDRKE